MKKYQGFFTRNSSTILTCIGAVGVLATAILTARATPKAVKNLEAAEEEKGEKLTKLEVVKAAGPAYIPAAVVGVSTVACIFGANALNKKQQAALTSAYALLDNSYKEYKKKVVDLYGEEADENVKQEIAKDKYVPKKVSEIDDEQQLFYDDFSQRYFKSTTEKVLRAEYELNKIMSHKSGAYLNEFYELLGIDGTGYGGVVGWSSAEVYDMCWSTWIDFKHSKIVLDDGMECTIVTALQEPRHDFLDY